MSVDPQELRATTADRADDEKTIQEEPTNDDGGDEELKKGIDQKGDPAKRSSSPSSDIQVSEKVESRENDFDEPPDGGLRAWLVVFGVRFFVMETAGFFLTNIIFSLPLGRSPHSVS